MTSEDPVSLAFRARVLAQAHALSPAAGRLLNRTVAAEASTQPRPEVGAWAGAALTQGYCLRCVQESADPLVAAYVNAAGAAGGPERPAADGDALDVLDVLDAAATECASQLRSGTGDETTIAALDLLVGSQVENRLEPWRDELDDDTLAELEQYLTWWVVKGYGLRVAETSARPP